MLWVPLVPLIVFLLSLVPAFYFGFRIGWRTALFISLLLFIFVGLFAITLYFSYQQTVWPWWKSIYIKKELNSGSGIDINLFSEINSIKKAGVLFSIGCLTPLALLFTLVIYQLVKRPLNKYLGHSTKDDDKQINKKKILIFKNRKPAKIAGGVILITNTVLVGSLVTSAANAAFVPFNKRSGFSRFTDTLGSVYGIGLGSNNLPSQVIHDFLNKLDSKMTNSILEFANVKQKQFSKDSSFMNKAALNHIINSKKILDDLFSNEEAAYQLFNAIMSESSLNSSINPLIFIPSIVSSNVENGNQIGYNDSDSYYSLLEVEKWFKDNEFIFKDFKFPNKVKELFLKTVKDNFKSFASTFSATNVNKVKELITNNKKTIEKLISEKNELLKENSKYVQERRSLLLNALPDLSGNNVDQSYVEYNIDDVHKASSQSTGKTYTFNGDGIIESNRSTIDSWFIKPDSDENPSEGTFNKNLNELTGSSNGTIYDKFGIYVKNKKISDQRQVRYDWYFNDYNEWIRTKYTPVEEELSKQKGITQGLENELSELTNEKQRFENKLSYEQKQLSENNRLLNKEKQRKAELEKLIPELERKLSALKSLTSSLESSKDDAKKELSNLKNDLSVKEQNKSSSTSELIQSESNLKIKEGQRKSIEAEIRELEKDKQKNDQEIQSKKNELNRIESEITVIKNKINTKKQEITQLNSSINHLNNRLVNAENTYIKAEGKYNKNLSEISQTENNININTSILKDTTMKISNLKRSIIENENQISGLEGSIASKIKDIENKNHEIRAQRIKEARAQKEFDRFTRIKNSKNTEVQSMKNLFNQASNINSGDWKVLVELISKYNNGINHLKNLNDKIINQEVRYKVLSETDNKYKVRAEAAGAYNHGITTKLSFNDFEASGDQLDSIYYQEQKRDFLRVKKVQLEDIKSNLQKEYDVSREKIIQYYKNWIKI